MSTSSRQSSRVTVVTTIVAALLLALPLLAAAQTSGTIDNAPQAVNAETGEDPTPTSIPPTTTATQAVVTPTPTTAPSPTATEAAVTPTATTTPSPSATATATATQDVATPTATATASPLPNTDTITTKAETTITLQPGEQRELPFSYQVTTPRTGTTIHAELRTATGDPATGWVLRGQASSDDWSGDGLSVDLTETTAITPGAAFTITFAIQAPAEVKEEQTTSLFVSSTATTDTGAAEVGISDDGPIASLNVMPAEEKTSSNDSGFSVQSVISEDSICDQVPASDIVTYPDSVEFMCASDSDLLTTLLTLDIGGLYTSYRIDVSGVTPGWEYAINGATTYQTGNANVSHGLVANLLLPNFQILVDLRPTSANPANQIGQVTIELKGCTLDLGLACLSLPLVLDWTPINTTTLGARTPAGAPRCTPSATAELLQFDASEFTGTAYPETPGTLDIRVAASGNDCSGLPAGWAIRLQPSNLTGPGTIVASDIAFAGTGSDQSGYLTPTSAFTFTGAGWQPIATTKETLTFPSEGITWHAHFTLDPDDDLPTGVYSGPFTIDMSNGL